MATQFAEPVSEETELEKCKSAIPQNTKSTMEWGIHTWTIGQLTDVFLVLMSPEFPVTTPLLDMTSTDLSYWMRKLHVVLEVGKKDSSM